MIADRAKWFRAALRISGERLQPAEISSLLGLEPSRTRLPGEPRSSNSNLVWSHALWCLESQLSDDRDPVDHLHWLLNLLEPKAALLQDLSGKFHLDFFCGFSSANGQGGFTLDPATLQRIARLGIPFTLDLYPPPPPPSQS